MPVAEQVLAHEIEPGRARCRRRPCGVGSSARRKRRRHRAAPQRKAPLVEAHHRQRRQRQREIDRHVDGDDLHRGAGLVEDRCRDTCIRSAKPTKAASEEFLVRARYWLISGGRITRIACGRITSRRACAALRPSAAAASRLAVRHGLHAGAHDFGDVGAGIERQREDQRAGFGRQPQAAFDIVSVTRPRRNAASRSLDKPCAKDSAGRLRPRLLRKKPAN